MARNPQLGGQDPDQDQDAKGGNQQDERFVLLNDLHGFAPRRFVNLVKSDNSKCDYGHRLVEFWPNSSYFLQRSNFFKYEVNSVNDLRRQRAAAKPAAHPMLGHLAGV